LKSKDSLLKEGEATDTTLASVSYKRAARDRGQADRNFTMQTKLALAAENGKKSDILQRGPRSFWALSPI
jgi:hypothetical protein